jgi:tetratricopeptide (TPR) repeat protein
MGRAGRAINYYSKVIEIAKRRDDNLSVARATRGMGIIQMMKGELESAEKNFEFFFQVAQDTGSESLTGVAYVDKANIANERGEKEKAFELFKKSIDLLEKTESFDDLAKAYNDYGDVLRRYEDFQTALGYFEKSMEAFDAHGNIFGHAWAEIKVAECCTQLGHVVKAMDHLERARGVLIELEDNVGLGEVYRISGLLMTKQTNWKAAEVHFEKSAKLFSENNRPILLINTYIELGKMFLAKDDRPRAKEWFGNAGDLSLKIDSKSLKEKVDELMKKAS